MKSLKYILPILVLLIGCSQGFDRGRLKTQLRQGPIQYTDSNIRQIDKIKSQASLPLKMAVALPVWGVTWTEEDKQKLLDCGKRLQLAGVVSQFTILPNMLLRNAQGIVGIRRAAARYQADVVLVINNVTDVDSYCNPAAILYITLIGMWIAPGNHKDVLCLMEGIVFDVRNEFIYVSAEAEGKGSTVAPLGFIKVRTAVKEAKKKALKKFIPEFEKHMMALKADPSSAVK